MAEQDFLDTSAKPPETGGETNPLMDIAGAGMGKVDHNPLAEADEDAGPEEQAQYEDVFKRVMAMVHDTREPEGGGKSMADSIIKKISNPEFPSYANIGGTAGELMRLFHNNAKRQGVEFPGDVLMNVGMDLITELMDIARVTGAVKDLPAEESPEEAEFARLATLEASRIFGEYMLETGQADTPQAQEDYQEQMEREATSGALDDWDMKEMDPEQLQAAVAQKEGIV